MASSATYLLFQAQRRRLRTVLHGLKFLLSARAQLDFFPPANPRYVSDGRRRATYERQRSLLDCVDPDDDASADVDETSYEDALSSFSPSTSASPSGTAATPTTGPELASDECFDRFIVSFHRRLVNEKKVSLVLPKCRCFASSMGAAGSTPTPSTTHPCTTPISPDSYFNLQKQKAAGYICS